MAAEALVWTAGLMGYFLGITEKFCIMMQNYFLLLHFIPILQSVSLSEINTSSLKTGFPCSSLFRSSVNKADSQLPVLLGQIVQYLCFSEAGRV